MRGIRLVIALICFVSVSYGQRDTLKSNKLSIEILPLSYLDDSPSYQFAVEIKLWHNFSACLEGGGYFGLNKINWVIKELWGSRQTDIKGYLVKPEIKYYWNKENISTGFYVSIEGAYKKQSYNWQDSIHLTPAYLTTFKESKNVYWFDAKFGQSLIYKSGIIIDWYVGGGVRFKNITSTLTAQQAGALQYNDDSNYDSDGTGITVIPGKSIVPNLTAGFKIGYCIK